MGTLGYVKASGIVAKTAEEAYNIIKNDESHSVVLYNSVVSQLDKEVDKLFRLIKGENTKISEVNRQWLPTYPYYWNDIDGCLAVRCAEISMDTFEHNAGGIALFTEWNYDVLTNPDERKPLDSKVLTTLVMIGSMIKK